LPQWSWRRFSFEKLNRLQPTGRSRPFAIKEWTIVVFPVTRISEVGPVLLVEALRSLEGVQQVILVGSDSAPDFFNVFAAGANNGIEDGIVAYGGGGMGDKLNVYGRLFVADNFTVTSTTFSTGTGDALGNDITVTVPGADVVVNGNKIASSGFETIRIVKLWGGGSVTVDPSVAGVEVMEWFNLFDDE
jgi:hypothetical protein